MSDTIDYSQASDVELIDELEAELAALAPQQGVVTLRISYEQAWAVLRVLQVGLRVIAKPFIDAGISPKEFVLTHGRTPTRAYQLAVLMGDTIAKSPAARELVERGWDKLPPGVMSAMGAELPDPKSTAVSDAARAQMIEWAHQIYTAARPAGYDYGHSEIADLAGKLGALLLWTNTPDVREHSHPFKERQAS